MIKSNKIEGITLVSLAITVIVLAILVSVATYSGLNVIQSAKLTTFTTELKIMQTQVNHIYESQDRQKQYGEVIEGVYKTRADEVFGELAKDSNSKIENYEGYTYWSKNYIKNELKIDGVEQSFFVNLTKRQIVSYEGFEYEGKTYYTLQQLPNGLYNVEYQEDNASQPNFDLKVEEIGKQKWQISITNVQYEGYIDKWQVQYRLEGEDRWQVSEDLNFIVNVTGNYEIQIKNGSVLSVSKMLEIQGIQLPTFEVGATKTGNGIWQLAISNIQYNGDSESWQVEYRLEGEEDWKTSENLMFEVKIAGNYEVKIKNQEIISEIKIAEAENPFKIMTVHSKDNYTDTNGDKATIPTGFAIIPGCEIISEGLVISDIENDYKNEGNQFVWVPIADTNQLTRVAGYAKGAQQAFSTTTFKEPYTRSGYTSETMPYDNMKTSVEQNHGFYIGRYEAGKDENENVIIKKGAIVFNNTKWGNSMIDISGGVVEKATDFIRANYTAKGKQVGVVSTLCYGMHWDAALKFIDPNYAGFVQNSEKQGWHSENYNSTETGNTQTNPDHEIGKDLIYRDNPTIIANKQKNIYDMAGNVWEWTMETNASASNVDNHTRITRGASCNYAGNNYPASFRSSMPSDNIGGGDIGFRIVLYIK